MLQHAAELQAEQRRLAEHLRVTAARLSNHPDGSARHAASWDVNVTSPASIYRTRVGLGDAEPERLVVEWTRFDFSPTVPWQPPSSKTSRGPRSGEEAGGGAIAGTGAASPGRSLRGASGGRLPSSSSALLSSSGASVLLQQQQQQQQQQGGDRGGAAGGSVGGSTRGGGGGGSLLLPPALTAMLSPSERALPLRPEYLLPSAAQHASPFVTLVGRSRRHFSQPPRDRPPTDAEARQARDFAVPDRTLFRPEDEGKPRWRPPPLPAQGRTAAGVLFLRLEADADWLRARDAAAAAEAERRFYAQGDEGGEEGAGEDGEGGGASRAGGGGASYSGGASISGRVS